ncbi:diguanylate cyclase (GGDEF)-like protein [Chromohalobacter marismortui]|uniref:diguanylate cyclase n=1 Tax=Chromohalobacter marismortui TaxID=42055 RepID=A0A4R7NSN5_9GAMM|nr:MULTISPECIES: GGDEF domain-containing protein [Chromohalobacter]MCI0509170.1 GGDEF domain-containing protein [Chromohalobacter sp.]MCI0592046.1 GGDEF domain-containing protein [Chromohalobacter sp.]TDU23937.1 diguanylate cyclase (GGDEF)-like protein [Chromohalobacter marismortui]
MAQIFWIASLGHVVFAGILVAMQIPAMIVLSVVCILANLVALVLHRRLQLKQAMTVKMAVTLLMLSIGIWWVGPDAGFEYYFFLLLCEILISDLSVRYKVGMSVAIGSVALMAIMLPSYGIPWVTRDASVSRALQVINLMMVFLVLGGIMWRLHAITERCEHHFRRDATHDYLTKVPNRRAIFHEADMLWHQQRHFTLLLLDADHFKQVNDTYGHTVGDEVLRHLAYIVRGALREEDRLGRVGGEEFLIVFPDSTRDEALTVASRIRRCLEEQPCCLETLTLPVTFSMGLAASDEVASVQELIALADRRLYRAKSAGRDQLVMSDLEIVGPATL